MSETGATAAQIEAAAAKWTTCADKDRPVYRQIVADYAAELVSPGARIFEEEDVRAVATMAAELRRLHDIGGACEISYEAWKALYVAEQRIGGGS